MTTDMPFDADAYFAERRGEQLDELCELLRIPSVSTLSVHADDVRRAAGWLKDRLERAGLEHVEIQETGGHPVVTADWLHASGAPTVLVYGHYDVQPSDPDHLWHTPPFEPTVRDGRLYARGATDDKGQMFMHMLAAEAWLKETGTLPVNVKFLIEGEEEIGSAHLNAFIAAHRNALAADFALISDSSFYAPGMPTICTGLRGLAELELTVRGPNRDVHSGMYGGAIANPIAALAQLAASLHDTEGRVSVDGFYDGVVTVSDAERQAIARLPFDEEAYRVDLGVPALVGEPGFSAVERASVRPTLEFNGIGGGFQGEGGKTIVPSHAFLKITCRLVPGQDPEKVLDAIERHLQAQRPQGVALEIRRGGGAPASVVAIDHPAVQTAADILSDVYGQPTLFMREGGSIPVVATFEEVLHVPTVLLGFGSPDEPIHSPNEFLTLTNFDQGLRMLARYLGALPAAMG